MNPAARLRIAMLVQNQIGAGTYWRAYYFARELATFGHEVHLLATSRSRKWNWVVRNLDGVRLVETADVFTGSFRSGWDPFAALRRSQYLLRLKPDIIHAYESRPTVLFPALFGKQLGSTLIMDWCDWFGRGGIADERASKFQRWLLTRLDTFLETRFRTCADGTTVISRFLERMAKSYPVPPESILLLRNGAYAPTLSASPDSIKREFGLGEKTPTIGLVGHIYQRRDAQFIADALNRLHVLEPACRLLHIGPSADLIRSEIADPSMIINYGWSDTADNLEKTDTARILQGCDICWIPLSDSGANQSRWPIKLSDYLAAGRPVVTTRVGDMPSVLEEYRFGVCSDADPSAFAESSISLLRDPERRRSMGEAARRLAEGDFHWTKLSRDLADFYFSRQANPRRRANAPG